MIEIEHNLVINLILKCGSLLFKYKILFLLMLIFEFFIKIQLKFGTLKLKINFFLIKTKNLKKRFVRPQHNDVSLQKLCFEEIKFRFEKEDTFLLT